MSLALQRSLVPIFSNARNQGKMSVSLKLHITSNDAFSQSDHSSLKDWDNAKELPIKRTTKPHTKPQ